MIVSGNPTISGEDFSLYFENQNKCAFALNRNSKITLYSANISDTVSIYNDIDCLIKTPSPKQKFLIDNFYNLGEIYIYNTTIIDNIKSTSNYLGIIHNMSAYKNEANMSTIDLKFPTNGGLIAVTFSDNSRKTIEVYNGNFSIGNDELSVSLDSHQNYLLVTLTSSKTFNFIRTIYR